MKFKLLILRFCKNRSKNILSVRRPSCSHRFQRLFFLQPVPAGPYIPHSSSPSGFVFWKVPSGCTGWPLYSSPRYSEPTTAQWLCGGLPGLCILFFRQIGLLASRFDVSHATAPWPTYLLNMLHDVWFEWKQTVVRVETDCGSSRSRPWFEWNQTLVRVEIWWPDGYHGDPSRRSGGRRTDA